MKDNAHLGKMQETTNANFPEGAIMMTFSFKSYPTTIMLRDSHPYHRISEHFPFHIDLFRVIPRHFPAHRHDFLESSYIVDGEGYQIINGTRYEMRPGTFFFLLPYQVHEMFTVSRQPLKIYNCMFDMNVLFQSTGGSNVINHLLFAKEELSPSVQLYENDLMTVESIFAQMLAEFKGNRIWKNDFLQAKLTELLIHFDRLREEERIELKAMRKRSSPAIWLVIRFIHLHYREPLSLSSLAETFGMGSSTLSQTFKQRVGMSIVQFLHEVRTNHACSLLTSTDMHEIDIAEEVGFGSMRSFSRIFRDVKRMTPNEYRKRFRLKPADS